MVFRIFVLLFISLVNQLNAATVGDLVWYDSNQNGIQNSGEPGMPSIKLVLYNATTNYPLDTTYSNAAGFYTFTELPTGYYYIVASQMPYGYIFTLPNIGALDTNDNDACPMGRSTLFTINAADTFLEYDFGLVVDNTPCALSSIECCQVFPSSNTYCFDSYLGLDDSISSVSTAAYGVASSTNQACITYIQNAGVASTQVDTVSITICNSFGDCHQVCIYISKDCIIAPPAILPCNDTIYTCLAVYPASMQLCVPSCLRDEGDIITNANSTFHCEVVINSDSCITYTSFPGMPLGYIDTVTIDFVNLMGHAHHIIYYLQIGCINDQEQAPQWVDTLMTTNVSVQYFLLNENQCRTVRLKTLDVDAADKLTYTTQQSKHGTALYNSNFTSITYCPDFGFKGIDSVFLKVCDSLAPIECDILLLLFEVPNPTPAPVFCNDTVYVCAQVFPQTKTYCFNYCHWMAGDTIQSASTFFNCSLDYIGDSCIKYTPLPGMTEAIVDTMKVRFCSPITGLCHWLVYVIDIGCNASSIDARPFFSNIISQQPINSYSANTTQNTCVVLPISSLDIDTNDALTFTLAPSTAAVTFSTNNHSITYCPPVGFVGQDTFLLTICDSLLPVQCRTIPIVITIKSKICIDTVPACQSIFPQPLLVCPIFCELFQSPVTIHYSSSIPCSVTLQGTNCYKIIQLPGTNNVTNYLRFVGCDALGQCDTLIYAIEIATGIICTNATNVVAQNDTFNCNNTNVNLLLVQANDECVSCTIAPYTVNAPTHGVALFNADGTISYIADAPFVGFDCFSYLLCNVYTGSCDTAQVCVLYQSNAPLATADVWLAADCDFDISLAALSSNDINSSSESVFSIIETTSQGIITLDNSTNTLTYNPTENYTGTDQFIYRLCNETQCDTALVIIQWNCPNAPPILAIQGQTAPYFMVQSDTFDILCYSIQDETNNLLPTYYYNGSGTIIQTQNCIQFSNNTTNANDTIMLIACDPQGLCDTSYIIIINLNALNIIAFNDYDTINAYGTSNISLTNNDQNLNGNPTTFSIIDSFNYGNATLDSAGILTYTNIDFFGNDLNYTDQLTYVVCQANNCDTANVLIYVEGSFDCDSFDIYNAITPNGDLINDYFVISCNYTFQDGRLIIFNRWGQIVFEASNYKNDWNGYWQNTTIKVPTGTYYYLFEQNQHTPNKTKRLSGYLYVK